MKWYKIWFEWIYVILHWCKEYFVGAQIVEQKIKESSLGKEFEDFLQFPADGNDINKINEAKKYCNYFKLQTYKPHSLDGIWVSCFIVFR